LGTLSGAGMSSASSLSLSHYPITSDESTPIWTHGN